MHEAETEFDLEYQSLDNFVEFLEDDERTEFSYLDIQALVQSLRISHREIRLALEARGFKLADRPKERRVRGVRTSSHDRWFGPGSAPTHGGSGWEQICGFAGQEG